MQAKEIIEIIRADIKDVEQKNNKSILVSKLLSYLDSLDNVIDNGRETDDSRKIAHENNLAHYDATQKWELESIRAVIGFAQTTLKSAILINGGAAIALLAFIGNIWSKRTDQSIAISIAESVGSFSYGVLFASFSIAGSYCAQYFYSNDSLKISAGFHILSSILVILSLSLFGYGIYHVQTAFVEHFISITESTTTT